MFSATFKYQTDDMLYWQKNIAGNWRTVQETNVLKCAPEVVYLGSLIIKDNYHSSEEYCIVSLAKSKNGNVEHIIEQ